MSRPFPPSPLHPRLSADFISPLLDRTDSPPSRTSVSSSLTPRCVPPLTPFVSLLPSHQERRKDLHRHPRPHAHPRRPRRLRAGALQGRLERRQPSIVSRAFHFAFAFPSLPLTSTFFFFTVPPSDDILSPWPGSTTASGKRRSFVALPLHRSLLLALAH